MKELFTQFGIDWKLLIAQAVNFFLLLFLLQKFAYKPVIALLRERRKKIEETVVAYEAAEKALRESKAKEAEVLKAAELRGLEIVDKATGDAALDREHILEGARQKSEQVIAQGRKVLDQEKEVLVTSFTKNAEGLLRKSLSKILSGMEPGERDTPLINEALRELQVISHTTSNAS